MVYSDRPPTPLVIDLSGREGFELRDQAAQKVLAEPNITGAERADLFRQQVGRLGEMVIRLGLGMEPFPPQEHPADYDLELPSGVRVDVKTRGGKLRFQETYEGTGGVHRKAKHNLFARQIYEDTLESDAFLFCHLQYPSAMAMPGTARQRNWRLSI